MRIWPKTRSGPDKPGQIGLKCCPVWPGTADLGRPGWHFRLCPFLTGQTGQLTYVSIPHTGTEPAIVHRRPQLLASLEFHPQNYKQVLGSSWDGRPFGRNRYGPKIGGFAHFCGEAESPSNTMYVAWAEAYLRTKWHFDPYRRLARIDMGQRVGAAVPPFSRGAESPSNTMLRGPRPTSLPSGILIYPALWPQQIWGRKVQRGAVPLWVRGSWVPT